MEYRMEIEVESGNTSINEVEETQLFEEIQEIMKRHTIKIKNICLL